MNKSEFVAELSKLRPSSTFLTLKAYRNEFGEVADHSIVFHISYNSALNRSINVLNNYIPKTELHAIARDELLKSFNTSLSKIASTEIEDLDDGYQRFFNDDGSYIKGVKMHIATETLHIYGLSVNKKIIIPGDYKIKNKRELTVAKDEIRRLCPVSAFRQYKITPNQVDHISVQGLHILPPNY